jgi:hypothetical protein
MTWRRIAAIAILVLAAARPATAGFWGDLKQSFDAALDQVQRDGEDAAEAVGEVAGDAKDGVVEGAGDAADSVVEGAESAADLVTGDSDASAASRSNRSSKPPSY